MPNNRATIDSRVLFQGPMPVERGIDLFGFGQTLEVREGFQALLLGDGTVRDVLIPGRYYLGRYPGWQNLQVIFVDTRLRTMEITTTGDFAIRTPVALTVDLDLSVEYRVHDARRVALEIENPLRSLYDRILEITRDAIGFVSIDDVRQQGTLLSQHINRMLETHQLHLTFGIEVLRVMVTKIKGGHTTADALADQDLAIYTERIRWKEEQDRLRGTQVTWEWLLMYRPEIAQQLIDQHGKLAELMFVRTGNPAWMMHNPLGTPLLPGRLPFEPGMSPVGPGSLSYVPGSVPGNNPPPASPSVQPALPSTSLDNRMQEERRMIEQAGISGINMKMRKSPDGYDVLVTFPSPSGRMVEIEFVCSSTYPETSPEMQVFVDKQHYPFMSGVIARWYRHYLLEVIHEVRRHVT